MSQSVKVWLDKSFLQTKGGGELLTSLEKASVQTIIDNLPVADSIFWTRCDNALTKDKQLNQVQHDHILIKLDKDAFINHVSSNDLLDYLAGVKVKAQVSQVTLLIQNFKQYLKSATNTNKLSQNKPDLVKTKKPVSKTPVLTKSELNAAIIQMELNENTCVRSYETSAELIDLILSYTKAVSEFADKSEKAESLMFCEGKGEPKSKIGKDGQGLLNVWKDCLECFPMVSCDQAQAICAAYPSPFLLYQVMMLKCLIWFEKFFLFEFD